MKATVTSKPATTPNGREVLVYLHHNELQGTRVLATDVLTNYKTIGKLPVTHPDKCLGEGDIFEAEKDALAKMDKHFAQVGN